MLPCTCFTKYQNKELLAPLIGSNNVNQLEANKKYFSRVGRLAGASCDITVFLLFLARKLNLVNRFSVPLMNWTKSTYTVIKIQVFVGGFHGSAHDQHTLFASYQNCCFKIATQMYLSNHTL